MNEVQLREAKARLSALVDAAERGEATTITRHGTPEAARRIGRVLWNDPASGVMRHADAGYETAIDCAREHGLDLPGILG